MDKTNKLNEVPVPILPEDNNISSLKGFTPNGASNLEHTNELSAFAHKPKPEKKRKGKGRKNRRKKEMQQTAANGTVIYEVPRVKQGKHRMINRRRRNKSKEIKGDTSIEHLKWKTYYSDVTISPLHPRGIVEEFVYTNQ